MKFIVYRTSDYKGTNIQPCDEAVLENKEDELRENEIYFWATWTVEIESLEALCAFCNKYGDVIIHPKEEDEEFPSLEIYDGYRE